MAGRMTSLALYLSIVALVLYNVSAAENKENSETGTLLKDVLDELIKREETSLKEDENEMALEEAELQDRDLGNNGEPADEGNEFEGDLILTAEQKKQLEASANEVDEKDLNEELDVQTRENQEPADEGDEFEGDLILTPEQKKIIEEAAAANGNKVEKRKFQKVSRKWPGGIVYYEPISNAHGSRWKSKIEEGIRHVASQTCITFKQRTSGPRIKFVAGRGCSSFLGMINSPNGQVVNINNPGCLVTGIVAHELLHALGFLHEQSRPDRDNYVTVKFENIVSGTERNFRKYDVGAVDTQGLGYDYGSVMHYGGRAFSKNGQYTIVAKDSSKQSSLGQRSGLSSYDIAIVKRLYCGGSGGGTGGGTTPKPQTTPKPGCLDSSSTYTSRCTSNKNLYCSYHYYYNTYCKKTCHSCTGTCKDTYSSSYCSRSRSYCSTSSTVLNGCKKTCNNCLGTKQVTTCRDSSSTFTSRCSSNRDTYCNSYSYYTTYCKKTCHNCRGTCRDTYSSSYCSRYRSSCSTSSTVLNGCKKTCNNCLGTKKVTSTTCSDSSSTLASRCSSNRDTYCNSYNYYTTYCKKTCHNCRGTCKDTYSSSYCSTNRGRCSTSSTVLNGCRKTCNNCIGTKRVTSTGGTSCVDRSSKCPTYKNYCRTSFFVRMYYCMKSCGTCSSTG